MVQSNVDMRSIHKHRGTLLECFGKYAELCCTSYLKGEIYSEYAIYLLILAISKAKNLYILQIGRDTQQNSVELVIRFLFLGENWMWI